MYACFWSAIVPLISTRRVWSTIKLFCAVHSLQTVLLSINLSNIEFEKNWERWKLSLGRLGGKRKCYLCAMLPPNCTFVCVFVCLFVCMFVCLFVEKKCSEGPERFNETLFKPKLSTIFFSELQKTNFQLTLSNSSFFEAESSFYAKVFLFLKFLKVFI